jgi:L-malate glycosyltransferase
LKSQSKNPLSGIKGILFITPTGGRTGSEMLLWYLLSHLKGKIDTAIYCRQNGELFAKESTADQTFLNITNRNWFYKIYEAIYFKIFKHTPEIAHLRSIHKKIKPDIWYVNTLMNPDIVDLAIRLNVPYLIHVHELVSVYDELTEFQLKNQLENAHTIICCSSIVQKRINQMGYKNTVLHHSFIDTSKIILKQNRDDLRQRLKIPQNAFVWLMSGTMNFRKGYDILPDLLENMPRNSYFAWLGSQKDSGVIHYIKQRVENENFKFLYLGSHSTDYYDFMNIADGFVLMAREDPFPLVMMEAAFLQKPIVGFNSGGISEFVIEGTGKVLDSFNPKDLGNAMIEIEIGKVNINKESLKNRALQFDIKSQIQKWEMFFETLVIK